MEVTNLTATFDDVFHEIDANEFEKQRQEKEWKTLKDNLTKDGYREGLARGHDDNLQSGFDCGVQVSFSGVHAIAGLRGKLCAIIFTHIEPNLEQHCEPVQELQDLLSQLTEVERKLTLRKREECSRYYSLERANVGVSDTDFISEDKDLFGITTEIINKCKFIFKKMNLSHMESKFLTT